MTKKILLATTLAVFTFSGCTTTEPKPSTDEVVKEATSKAVKVTEKVAERADKVTNTSAVPALPESSMKDQVVEEAVEIADEKTDGMATKVIESVQ